MKKSISWLLSFTLLLTLYGCSNRSSDIVVSTSTSTVVDGIEVSMIQPTELPNYLVIDGSSSTVMMHAAIRAYLTDAHFVDQHSQTYAALERLIPGNENPADLLLAVRYYDDAINDANQRGADLVISPIAKEGFVFLLHKDNPIDSLTQDEIRGIFSGKIKNWQELGGLDEEIVPVQRNWDSGSQTAIVDFMGDTSLTDMVDDDRVLLALSMGGMVETVWTTGSGAIGYNIYSWSLGHGKLFGMENLKLLAVDGIEPSIENLANSSYPLMVYTYSYYNRGNDKAKTLADWLLTDEGQKVIVSAGYVGIFGSYSLTQIPDFEKDEYESSVAIYEYYDDISAFDLDLMNFYSERQTDMVLTETLAIGKGKDVTVLYLVHFTENYTDRGFTRFIVLTRDKGGQFEVINEGEV